MKWYAKFGADRFILALGYKQELIKNYFAHYDLINNDLTVCTGSYRGAAWQNRSDNWSVTMVDTGEHSLKIDRLIQLRKYISTDFMLTYGDGIGDIDIKKLFEFHRSHGKIATVTGVSHPPRFGEITRNDSLVLSFNEKLQKADCMINGGFFVFQQKFFDVIMSSLGDLEDTQLPLLASEKELMVYEHKGQFVCMDTQKDMGDIQNLWDKKETKWRVD
jgi:glucose-1-phosphate cytidylyltransferase